MQIDCLMRRYLWIRLATPVAALLVVLGCADREPVSAEFPYNGQPGQSPVWAVVDQLEYGDLVIYPEPDVDWRELVDLRMFEGFWPGMTFRSAKREVGQPDRQGDGYLGPFWDYERPLGTIRIAHPLKGSIPFLRWWRLEGFPELAQVEQVFHPSVAEHIPLDRERLTVVIMNNLRSPGAFVRIENSRVTSIDWVNNRGSGGTRDHG